MTREEAKRRIEICRDFLANNYSDMGEPNFTAFNMAIKALSQEPTDDALEKIRNEVQRMADSKILNMKIVLELIDKYTKGE